MKNPFDQFDEGVTATTAAPAAAANPFDSFDQTPAANPFDAFDQPKPETSPVRSAHDAGVLVDAASEAISASLFLPPFATKPAARALLTGGGRAGDIAAEVIPAVSGAIAGTFALPGAGTAAGGAAGAAVGNTLKQARELVRGERTSLGAGELALSTAAGALPVPGLKATATPLLTAAKIVGARGAQGGVVAGVTEAGREVIDEGTFRPGDVAAATAMGAGFGAVLGGVEGAVAARRMVRLATAHGTAEVPAESLPAALRPAAEPPAETMPLAQSPRAAEAPAAAPAGEILPGPEGAQPLSLVESAKASPQLREDFRARLAGAYDPQSNETTLKEAARLIDVAGDLATAKTAFLSAADPDAITQAMGLEITRRLQSEGRFQEAADVLYHAAQNAKSQGQAIQVLSTLAASTPEGVAAIAQRMFGRKLTGAELAGIAGEVARVQETTNPLVRLARQAQMLDKLQQGVPRKWDEKAAAAMNIAMLLNPSTVIRNIAGNIVAAAGNLGADVIAPVVDSGVRVFTGRRTVAGPQLAEYMKGLAQPLADFKAGWQTARAEGAGLKGSLREGVETMATLGRLVSTDKIETADIMRGYRSAFSSPLMRGFEKTMSVVMGSPDRAFYTGRLRASLANQMKAAGALAPTAEMLDQAATEAARAIYQDRNFVSNSLRSIRDGANYLSTFGQSRRFGAGQAIVPFIQVPSSLLLRGAEFTPAGFLRAMSEGFGPMFKGGDFSQRAFSDAMARALGGTTALVGGGYALAQLGIMTATPFDDPKVRTLKRDLGVSPYEVNLSALKRAFQSMDWRTPQKMHPGDLLYTYDWAQPIALPLALGAGYVETTRRNDVAARRGKLAALPGDALAALASGTLSLEEQPLLQGLSGFMRNAVHTGTIEAVGEAMAKVPGQFVPAALRKVQALLDNRIYETTGSSTLETNYRATAANVPGLAAALGYKPRTDTLGDAAERFQANGNSFFNVLVNPGFATRLKSAPEGRELLRLWERTGNLAQIPERVTPSITINGRVRTLTTPEIADYTQFVGRISRDAFRQLMRNEGYREASDEQRAKVMANAVSSANTAARVLLLGDQPKTLNPMARALIGAGARQRPAMASRQTDRP